MKKTLAGERDIEYAWVNQKLPRASPNSRLLDLGPEASLKTVKIALSRDWEVTACGLENINRANEPGVFSYICADFLKIDFGTIIFDWTLNVSTIEHFGLAGRYGVTKADPMLDLVAMHDLSYRTRNMILTVPIGVDTVWSPYHRVYGTDRLPDLLSGWKVREEQYWAKPHDDDNYVPVSASDAYGQHSTIDPFYYCVGTFILTSGVNP